MQIDLTKYGLNEKSVEYITERMITAKKSNNLIEKLSLRSEISGYLSALYNNDLLSLSDYLEISDFIISD